MKYSVGIFLLLLTVLAYAQNVEWIARYEPGSTAEAIAVDNSGNVYVCGYGSGASIDYITIKYNSAGDTLWVRYYDGGGSFYDFANALAIDDAGNVYVTGRSISSGSYYDIATIKYNSAGVQQWVAQYDGTGANDDEGNDIAVDDAGNVYVTGVTSTNTGAHYITIKYDSSGDTAWTVTYGGPDSTGCVAQALALDDSGNVYVTGEGYSSASGHDYATVKYDASGAEEWVAVYNGLATYADDHAYDIAYEGGYVYVTGESENASYDPDYFTIKYTSAGDTVWTDRFNGPGDSYDRAYALDVDTYGNVYVTGESFDTYTSVDYATIKYNSSGDIEWTARYNGPDSAGDGATAIVVDDLGDVYVTGNSYADEPYTPENDYLTVKYNPSGVEEWTARYDGTGHTQDYAFAITVDNAGFVYVTGGSTGNTSYEDFVTIKYACTGIEEVTAPKKPNIRLSAHPNPFRKLTTISFGIEHSAQSIELEIYDVSGRLVRNLNCAVPHAPCTMQIIWDGTDEAHRPLPSGVYFLRSVVSHVEGIRDYIAQGKLLFLR